MTGSVLTVGLSPSFERVLVFDDFTTGVVNRAKENYLFASGKAVNVTRVLKMLKTSSTNITYLPAKNAPLFLSLAEDEGITVKSVPASAVMRTCTTVIDRKKGQSTELVEECGKVEELLSDRILDLFRSEAPHHSAIVISGKKAPGFKDDLIPQMVKNAGEKGLLTILDIRGADLLRSLEYSPSLIKPNLSEFCDTFSLKYRGDDDETIKEDIERMMREIYRKYGTMTLVTRGSSSIFSFDGSLFIETDVEKVDAVNTIGCGDTLTAGVTYMLMGGKSLKEAAEYGALLAGRKARSTTFYFDL